MVYIFFVFMAYLFHYIILPGNYFYCILLSNAVFLSESFSIPTK